MILILICSLLLALLPLSIELGTEVYRSRVLRRTDQHAITFWIRTAIMLICSLAYSATAGATWYQVFAVSVTLHYFLFNYLFNRYGLENAVWYYLGNNRLDRVQKRINPVLLLFIKIILFVSSCVWVL